MKNAMNHACVICGSERPHPGWFLVASNQWQDRFTVMHWNQQLAGCSDAFSQVCCARHVEELVVHWMTTGSLNYPFANPGRPQSSPTPAADPGAQAAIVDAQVVGELIVHRESLPRVLADNPYALAPVLEALVTALQEDETHPAGADEFADDLCLVT